MIQSIDILIRTTLDMQGTIDHERKIIVRKIHEIDDK